MSDYKYNIRHESGSDPYQINIMENITVRTKNVNY